MYNVLALVVAGMVAGGLALSGSAAPELIRLCDYIPPESRYVALELGFNYRSFEDQYLDDRASVTGGSSTLHYLSLFDSASYGYDFGLDVNIGYYQGEWSYSGSGGGSYSMYLAEGDLFAFGGAVIRVSSAYKGPGLNVTSGSGYGRFRDVTPLAKAVKLGDALAEMESLTGPLPDETLLAIAQEIGRRVEYPTIDGLVAKIAELIEGTGLVALPEGKLGPVEVLKIEEIIEAPGDKRLCGFAIRGGLGYELLEPLGQARDFLILADLNYATAPTIDSQLLAKLEFNSSFAFLEDYSLSSFLSYTQRLSPYLNYTASHLFLRLKADEEPIDSHVFELKVNLRSDKGWNLTWVLSFQWRSGYQEWTQEFSLTATYSVF